MQINYQAAKRRLLLALLVGLAVAAFYSCEKDDICVEGDTPLLIVTFFDAEAPEESKSVTRLRVLGLGREEPVGTFNDRSNTDSIALPLRTDGSQTGFVFIFQSESAENGEETGNRDTLYFDYQTREEFISRACGFVARFENLESRTAADGEPWIDAIEIRQSSVITTDSAHVSIFH